MKMICKYDIKEITKQQALEMVKKYHYSNTLPKLNKKFIGFYLDEILVGIVTLGWGTRPRHTIQALFPSLDTKDYYEIGRMCMIEEMPRNSESQMLSQLIKWIKENNKEIKVLFTWADGVMGKVGYVYQSSNFIYAGRIMTDIYMKDNMKIHPRQMKAFLSPEDKRITVRPTIDQLQEFNIKHYKGKQYKYLYYLCEKKEQKRLNQECNVELSIRYPKESDLVWMEKSKEGKWLKCEKPLCETDIDKSTHYKINLERSDEFGNQVSMF